MRQIFSLFSRLEMSKSKSLPILLIHEVDSFIASDGFSKICINAFFIFLSFNSYLIFMSVISVVHKCNTIKLEFQVFFIFSLSYSIPLELQKIRQNIWQLNFQKCSFEFCRMRRNRAHLSETLKIRPNTALSEVYK